VQPRGLAVGRPTLQQMQCPGQVKSHLSFLRQTGAAHGEPGERLLVTMLL
jgi:hypothetical protein